MTIETVVWLSIIVVKSTDRRLRDSAGSRPDSVPRVRVVILLKIA